MKFNSVKDPVQKFETTNKVGATSFVLDKKVELASLVTTSLLKDKFYETEKEQLNRIVKLCQEIDDKLFIGKLAIYVREKHGLRSVSHVLAGELAKSVKGEKWTKDFYNKVVFRVDDMMEILGYYFSSLGKKRPLPNSLKKGFAKAFNKFDAYQLAKYKGNNRNIKLIDVVNLVHPKPVSKNGTVEVKRIDWAEAKVPSATIHLFSDGNTGEDIIKISTLEALVLGLLKNENTWEAKQSEAGKKVSEKAKEMNLSTEEKEKVLTELKTDNWKDLLKTKKLGYMALIKNVRNILETKDTELINLMCEQLKDRNLIKSSKILPFRFLVLIAEIGKLYPSFNSFDLKKVMASISIAVDIALENMPVFKGSTLIAVDVSGSMTSSLNGYEGVRICDLAGLFGVSFYKKNMDSDFVIFDSHARYLNLNSSDSTLTLLKTINFSGGATYFDRIFKIANKPYDRIIILSDMQSYDDSKQAFKDYKERLKCNPYLYCVDLSGYGTTKFPEPQISTVFGISEKMFDNMLSFEIDKQTLISEIEKIVI